MTYQELLNKGIDLLKKSGGYANEASLLLLEYTRALKIDLYLNINNEVSLELSSKYLQGIERLIKCEPLAYIIGTQPFYGYDFIVDKRVLIPRFETEELVGEILMLLDEEFIDYSNIKVLDVGCGSGAIGLTLALEEKRILLTSSDISSDALELAEENAQKLNVEANFICSDMLEKITGKFDVIVANPPYIRNDAVLESSVKDYEPEIALFGGDDGLYYYRILLANIKEFLNSKYLIAMEIGYDQKVDILALANKYFPQASIEVKQDLNGKDRMLIIKGS
ncbi:MAG: peptide chain release factor N(5)-glutamine methyltransferase [Erysipelotrichaceae bacterium]